MKLTVVTTTYNQEKYIGQAIEGMLMQKTNFPFQILISNDCSTDATEEILKKYKSENPDKIIIVQNEKNIGAMKNFINTLSLVNDSEYVALCDGDDFWTDKNKLQKQIDFLEKNKDYTICFHKSKLFYENGEKESLIIPQNIPEVTTINDLVEQNYIVANSVVYRWMFNNKKIKDVFPADIVPGDYYIHLMHAQNGKIKMINEVMSAYRRHSNGMWWTNDKSDKEEFSLKYGKKFLNFYNAADKNIKLPANAFHDQRKDIIYNIIVAYIKNNKFEELKKMFTTEKDMNISREVMNEIVNRNIWFQDYLAHRDEEIESTKSQLEELQYLRNELDSIKNSRWWKIRNFIKNTDDRRV